MKKIFRIAPQIVQFGSCKEFIKDFEIGQEDVILTNPTYFEAYFNLEDLKGAHILYANKYGKGEPSDIMVEQIAKELEGVSYKRLIAIGGGSIIDISKLLVQNQILPLTDLFDKKIPTCKEKELVIVPTTCGTGSEVTSVSVIELIKRGTKMGLQTDEEFADYAVLIPELLNHLPDYVFATSSIDALIHAVESFLSPKATAFSEMYSKTAIQLILTGYREIAMQGKNRNEWMEQFQLASTYAGIAFANAGCAAVHAMSMSYSGSYHVPHGESNYVIFTSVLKTYKQLKPHGKLEELEKILKNIIPCKKQEDILDALEQLLSYFLPKKKLHEYGVTKEKLPVFVETVMNCQQRLTANNYTPLSQEDMLKIYQDVF